MPEENVSRRRMLRGVAAGAVASGMAGEALANTSDDSAGHVVGLKADASHSVASDRAKSVRQELDFGDIGKAVAGQFSAQALEALENSPQVRYVEEDTLGEVLAQTLPWGIDRVDADVLHANGETGGDNTDGEGGAHIVSIDTGVDSDHPDLEANLGTGKAFVSCTPTGDRGGGLFCSGNDNPCNTDWDDDHDHGTHTMGTADAIDNDSGVVGVSTTATIHPAKVCDECGSCAQSDTAAALEWAADQGYDAANISLGFGSADQTLQDACQYAYDNGVLIASSAGNDGECTDCVGYPASDPNTIAVSATSSDDSLASFSSTGPEVELAAPGEDVLSTIPGGTGTMSGTSMASPHVAGAGAQLMDNGYSNSEARTQLQSTAEDIGLGDNEQGYGLLDVEAAVSGGGGGDNTAPSCSIASPNDGATVSGTVTVQVDAADSEDDDTTLAVEVSIDGGTYQTASYNSTSGYYEYDWDSTAVSDGDHTVDARATDSSGATTNASQITVTTDNGSSGDTAPAIDTFSITNNSNGGWARFDVDWAASDADGDLSTVDLVLDQNGTVDTASNSVSGSSASGSDRLEDKKGSGSYDVTLTVTDSAGNSTSQTKTVTA